VKPNTYSVTVSFRGSGLDVDVVPILYNGDPNWYGNLVSQMTGRSSDLHPRHLEFVRKAQGCPPEGLRPDRASDQFWARNQKRALEGFRFKSS